MGRAELSRTELFREAGGLAVSMQQRVFRTPGCGGEREGRARRGGSSGGRYMRACNPLQCMQE